MYSDGNAASGGLLVTFPASGKNWPQQLAASLADQPWLQGWLDEVLGGVNAWLAGEHQRNRDEFGQDLRGTLSADCDASVAVQAPFMLAGNVLSHLAELAALEADGLELADARTTGQGVGLISAVAAGRGNEVASAAVIYALILGACASAVAADAGLAVSPQQVLRQAEDLDVQQTPMAAVSGVTRAQLQDFLAQVPGTERAMSNGYNRHVVSGTPASLAHLRALLDVVSREQQEDYAAGRRFGAPLRASWRPLSTSVAFHHSELAPAIDAAVGWATASGVQLPTAAAVIDPATGGVIADDVLGATARSVLASAQDWAETLLHAVSAETVVVAVADDSELIAATTADLLGTGAPVVYTGRERERERLLAHEIIEPTTSDYLRFAPVLENGRVVTKHTLLTGLSPFILAGMTPTTADAGIVAAAANAGYMAELAGGGQVSERIFNERMIELGELLDPGREVVLNSLFLDRYLWDLHVGSARLVQTARAQGAPICGVTISAGAPPLEQAVELLDELNELGIWLNALKPGSVRHVRKALEIAAATEHNLWLQVEGGKAGGHHSWDRFEETLLETYDEIRQHDNVVLAVGGGVGTPERAAELLTGQWSVKYGVMPMPIDAILLGTVAMTALEAKTTASVKRLLVETKGPEGGWVGRAVSDGGMTSGVSGFNADIHFVDNTAARVSALLNEVAGDPDALVARREEVIEALSATAKPYFGDVHTMTYEQLLRRFAELTAIGHHGRYQDGVWLDPGHRERFLDLLRRAEAHVSAVDSGAGPVPTLFAAPGAVDDPDAAIDALVVAYPAVASEFVASDDVEFAIDVFRRPGKPVPFVPVIDADVRRTFTSDAMWQSHDERYDADQVLIIPGPAAVSGITRVDEPIAEMLGRFESHLAASLAESQ